MTKMYAEMTWQAYYQRLMQRRHAPKSSLIQAMIIRSNAVLQQLAAPAAHGKYA